MSGRSRLKRIGNENAMNGKKENPHCYHGRRGKVTSDDDDESDEPDVTSDERWKPQAWVRWPRL